MATLDTNQLAAIDQRIALINTDAEGAAAQCGGSRARSREDVAMLALSEWLGVHVLTGHLPF